MFLPFCDHFSSSGGEFFFFLLFIFFRERYLFWSWFSDDATHNCRPIHISFHEVHSFFPSFHFLVGFIFNFCAGILPFSTPQYNKKEGTERKEIIHNPTYFFPTQPPTPSLVQLKKCTFPVSLHPPPFSFSMFLFLSFFLVSLKWMPLISFWGERVIIFLNLESITQLTFYSLVFCFLGDQKSASGHIFFLSPLTFSFQFNFIVKHI